MDNVEKANFKKMQHDAFIATTDRKSLYTQLKNLVQQAQQVAQRELEQRRNSLKLLIEYEDQIYEEEFANKVKSRIDMGIRERRDNLLKIKEESTKNEQEFLKSKRIQQYMNSCYEIREALRYKDTLNVKECQLEQMLEKERAIKKEKDLEKYWLDVRDINLKLMDEQKEKEECLKKVLVKQVNDMRKIQLEEKKDKLKKYDLVKQQEKNKIDDLVEELRLEAFDKNVNKNSALKTEYRNELLKMMNEKQANENKLYEEETAMHKKLMNDIAHEKADQALAEKERKNAFYQATMDFIKFVKSVRKLEDDQQQLRNNRIDELGRMDLCTKKNILFERQRKARIAEECYAALRQQICEQSELRLREEAEYRECKMLENRFVHKDISRAEILSKQQKVREELDKQIEKLKQLRQDEETKFSYDLQCAGNDPQLCNELAKKYIKEDIDYLEPHPNWQLINNKSKDYRRRINSEDYLSQVAVPKKCTEPCVKSRKNPDDGRGDG